MDSQCSIDGCSRPMKYAGLGWCQTHYHRNYRTGSPHGIGTNRKENPKYRAVHARLAKERGKASSHVCDRCGAKARSWSYDGSDPNELTEIGKTGYRKEMVIRYSTDLNRYQPLCNGCHVKRDRYGS